MCPSPDTGLPRVLEAAEEAKVVYDQLEFLMLHAAAHQKKHCSQCRRYAQVRKLLAGIFDEQTRA